MMAEYSSDAVVRLRMPGGFLTAINAAAAERFPMLAEKSVERGDPFWVLAGEAPPLSDCSPFENAYKTMVKRGRPVRYVLGVRNAHRRSKRERWYDLLLAHLTPASRTEMWVRFLPFPSGIRLHITGDSSAPEPDPDCSRKEIRVAALPLFDAQSYGIGSLCNAGIRVRLASVVALYRTLLEELVGGASPSAAWRSIHREHPIASHWVPPSVAKAFSASGRTPASSLVAGLRSLLTDPLDSVILSRLVYPALLRALKEDKSLHFAPRRPLEERDRYLRLQLPLKELIAQDEYLHWLPSLVD